MLYIFEIMVICDMWYTFVLPDVLFRLNGAKRRGCESVISDEDFALMYVGRALASMDGLWFYAYAIPQSLIAVLSSLTTGLDGDTAYDLTYDFAIFMVIGLGWAMHRDFQRLQQDLTIDQDGEAHGHAREKPDLRRLPAISRETSLAYVQKLKRKLGTYLYQQDN